MDQRLTFALLLPPVVLVRTLSAQYKRERDASHDEPARRRATRLNNNAFTSCVEIE